MWSVTMPSAPRSSSRCISAASSRDHEWNHTCTCLPRSWARRTSPGVTRVIVRPAQAVEGRDLEHRCGGVEHPAQRRRGEPQQRRPHLARGGRDARAEGGAGGPQAAFRERPDADPFGGAVPQHLPDRRLDRRVRLDVDVDARVGELLEQLGQQRDGLRTAHPRLAHCVVGQRLRWPHGSRTPGRAPCRGTRRPGRHGSRARRSRRTGTPCRPPGGRPRGCSRSRRSGRTPRHPGAPGPPGWAGRGRGSRRRAVRPPGAAPMPSRRSGPPRRR